MTLKQASLLAFIGTLLLSIHLAIDLVLDVLSMARGTDPRGDAADILDPRLRCRERGGILLCFSPSAVVRRRVQSRSGHFDGHPHIHRRRDSGDVLGGENAARDGAEAATVAMTGAADATK